MSYRTHFCGTLSQPDEGQIVTLAGWVDVRRDLGGLIFIELRDHTGKVQLLSDPQRNQEVHEIFETLRPEFVIQVKGKVRTRPDGTENRDLRSGAVEVLPNEVTVLNKAKTLPLPIEDFGEADEVFKLKHRFLDLRREEMQYNIRTRHKITQAIREFLVEEEFLEIETPILTRSTPEGARDYLVPSRTQPGKFFALPQSPQLFKQLLMASGFEKYFQIARCFRDEDLRADRQPEFTQVDIEISFATVDTVIQMTEGLLQKAFEAVDKDIDLPIQRMNYKEAMSRFGSDKPDLRFGMELIDFTDLMEHSGFDSFTKVAKSGGIVKGICVPKTAEWSRKDFDDLRALAISNEYGAKGLAWISYREGEDELGVSPIAKFFSKEDLKEIKEKAKAKNGDTIFFVGDKDYLVHSVLGKLRLHLANKLNLINPNLDALVWIVDWPLLEKDPDTGAVHFANHPFTAVNANDAHLLDLDPELARAQAYDIVYNGVELGGGSIRNHTLEAQLKALSLLGLDEEAADEKFGFLLQALSMGAPPHGGLALGLDRIVMMLTGATSLRQVIAFPKVQSASCLLTHAPAEVAPEQLQELSIRLSLKK
ncbi:MAG: aspartate--tRNA ligase [Candidatus Caenarcaniphilales bacterium]|nr:aspartate--tRNA ligase [Candidatus Caenarcaniphilales bacterium]